MFQATSSCMQSCICKHPTHAASHMQNYMSSCMQMCREEGCREPCRQNLFLVLNPFRPMPLYSFSVSDFAPKRQLLLQDIACFWRPQKPELDGLMACSVCANQLNLCKKKAFLFVQFQNSLLATFCSIARALFDCCFVVSDT